MSALYEFATWEPLVKLLSAGDLESGQTPANPCPSIISGAISRTGWGTNQKPRRPRRELGRALRDSAVQEQRAAIAHVQKALPAEGLDLIQFIVEFSPDGRVLLYLVDAGPSIERHFSGDIPGTAILVENAVPEPWRRGPEPYPKTPARTADPELLERLLRERIPDAAGATEAEIDAAQERLGVQFPDELRVLYRVMRSGDAVRTTSDDEDAEERAYNALDCMLVAPDELEAVTPESRYRTWRSAATEALDTAPHDAVQDLVGSPGWICFGYTYGGDQVAIDLTPGPRGHLGQVILLSHGQSTGAELLADSLTDLVLNRSSDLKSDSHPKPAPAAGPVAERLPRAVIVHDRSGDDVHTAAHPGLEVLRIGAWTGAPLSLAPVAQCPKLRTLTAYSGTIADPLTIAQMTGLEYLELGAEEWRELLDANAVPRSLKSVAVTTTGRQAGHPLTAATITNELLALWGRPLIKQTTLEGRLPATDQ